jgi:periplasmic protein CpxP/Spy
MKHTLFAIALGGMLALSANAALYAQDQPQAAGAQQQGQPGQGHRHFMNPDRQLQHLTKKLNLTADQQTQIKPILVDRQQKMQALWHDQSLSQQDRHSRAEAIRQDTRTRLEATLNDQQKQEFEQMQANMQNRRHRMGGDNPTPPSASPQPE